MTLEFALYSILGIIVFGGVLYYIEKPCKKKTVILADNCDECPFKRKSTDYPKGQPPDYYYQCNLKNNDKENYFKSTKEMNESCGVGRKLEITIKKQ